MNIALSTDHAGFDRLKKLAEYLRSLGHTCHDYGPSAFNVEDDYPDFIFPAAQSVARSECDLGIIMGSSGQGEAMVANRVKGVRCALYYGPSPVVASVDAEGHSAQDAFEILRLSRQHNNANMLSLAARFLSQSEIEQAVTIWLETPFSNIERHARRVQKIDQLS
jgi:ribose 5-phosphate isomerase B